MLSSRRLVKAVVKGCKNEYWLEKASRMQRYAESNDLAMLYQEIKQIEGPRKPESAFPILDHKTSSLVCNPNDILETKVAYTTSLFSSHDSVNDVILNGLESTPVAAHLDEEPTFEEVVMAVKCLKNNKSAGMDGVPSEVWKYGGDDVVDWLHSEIRGAWKEANIPSSWKDAEILLLWKGKGSRYDLHQYRTIALLATAGKVFAKVLQSRISLYAEENLLSSSCQWGFRIGKSTIDPLSIVHRLEEYTNEKKQQLHLAFLDISKAYDSVDRPTMWKIMSKFGFPPKLIEVVQGLHDGQKGRILQNGVLSRPFGIQRGLRQGCVLAPTLFSLYMEAITRQMQQNLSPNDGLKLRVRMDGDLFNVQRFKSKTNCSFITISHLLYADDALLIAPSRDGIQKIVSAFQEAVTAFGLEISVAKTKTLTQGCSSPPIPIQIYGSLVEQVSEFCYLGAVISETGKATSEISSRISKMQSAFGRLWRPVFGQKSLSVHTKLMVYSASVLSVMRYGLHVKALFEVF